MPSFPYSPIYAHSSAHRMPRARICSLEYRESAQWGAAAIAALAQQSGLLPHDREDRPRLPPVALYHWIAPAAKRSASIGHQIPSHFWPCKSTSAPMVALKRSSASPEIPKLVSSGSTSTAMSAAGTFAVMRCRRRSNTGYRRSLRTGLQSAWCQARSAGHEHHGAIGVIRLAILAIGQATRRRRVGAYDQARQAPHCRDPAGTSTAQPTSTICRTRLPNNGVNVSSIFDFEGRPSTCCCRSAPGRSSRPRLASRGTRRMAQ
jgi:hypothetical protein